MRIAPSYSHKKHENRRIIQNWQNLFSTVRPWCNYLSVILQIDYRRWKSKKDKRIRINCHSLDRSQEKRYARYRAKYLPVLQQCHRLSWKWEFEITRATLRALKISAVMMPAMTTAASSYMCNRIHDRYRYLLEEKHTAMMFLKFERK